MTAAAVVVAMMLVERVLILALWSTLVRSLYNPGPLNISRVQMHSDDV